MAQLADRTSDRRAPTWAVAARPAGTALGLLCRHWPLAGALALAAAIAAIELRRALALTGGSLVYVLDDPYIHMAMAKNISLHGVWGVTPFGFTSASSSPLWLMLLAAWYRIGGVSEQAPLALNVASGALLLVVCHARLRRLRLGSIARFALLAAVVLFMPIVPIAMTGLEHLLHAALAVLFLDLAAESVAESRSDRSLSRPEIALLCVASLMIAARYEGLFLAGPAVLCLLLRGRPRYAAALALASFLPIVAYGLFSTAHGWEFLPNSLLLKGNMPPLGPFGMAKHLALAALQGFGSAPHLLVPSVAGLSILCLRSARIGHVHDVASSLITLTFLATVLHLVLARVGWFYRYEAYLVAAWIVAIGGSWPEVSRALRTAFGCGLLPGVLAATIPAVAIAPVLVRARLAHAEVPLAARNIYEQQYQMGLFVRQFYAGRGVAANDIGALNFLAEIDNLDLWGLASIDVARARRERRYDTNLVDRLARSHGADIAIVYDDWFKEYGGLPPSWLKIGEWEIRDNVVAGGSVVSFYATSPRAAARLGASLREFSSRLPSRVIQRRYPTARGDVDELAGTCPRQASVADPRDATRPSVR